MQSQIGDRRLSASSGRAGLALLHGSAVLALSLFGFASGQEPGVAVTVQPQRIRIFQGESIQFAVKIANQSSKPVKILQLPDALTNSHFLFELRGKKSGPVERTLNMLALPEPGTEAYKSIQSGKEEILTLDLAEDAGLRATSVDTYSLTVSAKLDARYVHAQAVNFIVDDLPKLQRTTVEEVTREFKAGNVKYRVESGFLAENAVNDILFVVVQRTGFGGNKFTETRTLRLGACLSGGMLETTSIVAKGQFEPADIHILLTAADLSQTYWVLSLNSYKITRSESFPERKVRFLKSEATGKVEVEIKQ
jgi:hypothetical protein